MEPQEILKNNKLIAEFMGWKQIGNFYIIGTTLHQFVFFRNIETSPLDSTYIVAYENKLLFDSSWDWLMPVINQIGEKTDYELIINSQESYWNKFGDNPTNQEYGGYSNIENIWIAVIEFIKWYNTSKNDEQ